jgi:ribulose-5-phosphate 4-epimerase/fuculose-1-phosphate aldolase
METAMSMLVSERPAAERSAEEMQVRRDLAALYRAMALYGWDDLTATHISARVPGPGDAFLINPYGLLFEEITASSLIKINAEGEILEPTPYAVNAAGFVIHSAVHMARPDAGCVVHLHTLDGVAVSALEEGLLPLNQGAMVVADQVAFHDYEGVAVEFDERERLAADLGTKNAMLLRNHGTLAVGRTVAEAFSRIYFLERACTVQVRTLSMGRPVHPVAPEVIAKVTAQLSANVVARDVPSPTWPAMLRKLDRLDPSYKD